MSNQQLVLASSSPFRKELLGRLMMPFDICSPDIDETPFENETPQQLVERLATEKAKAVADQYPKALIIGSDQVALHGNKIVGKPHTHDVAVQQLREASAKSIKLFTGLSLYNAQMGSLQSLVEPFTVHFRSLSDDTIERYLKKEKPYNCAGSVRSEGLGVTLIERYEGNDPAALIGLPLIQLISMLNNESFEILV